MEEIAKEKQAAIDKKEEEKLALRKLLEENEVRKLVLADQLQEERDQDLKNTHDYARILDQQEKDRSDYFKIRERKSGDFMAKVVDGIIKDMDVKTKKEADARRQFEIIMEKK